MKLVFLMLNFWAISLSLAEGLQDQSSFIAAENLVQSHSGDRSDQGCMVENTAQAANDVYNVYEDFRAGDLKSKIKKIPNAPGLYAVPASVNRPNYSPKPYRLSYVFSGRDTQIKNSNSDLFVGVYEARDPYSNNLPMLAFKGTSAHNSDWSNNFLNRGAGQVRAIFQASLDEIISSDSKTGPTYVQFFIQWFSARASRPVILTGHSLGGSLAEANARFFDILLAKNKVEAPEFQIVMFNSMGASGMIKNLGRTLRKPFEDQNSFRRISRVHFRTQRDPLQTLNRYFGLTTFSDAVILPSRRGFLADGSFVMPTLVSEHFMDGVLEDIHFAQSDNAIDFLTPTANQDTAKLWPLYSQALRYTGPANGKGPALKVETADSKKFMSFILGQSYAEEQLKNYAQARRYVGNKCTN